MYIKLRHRIRFCAMVDLGSLTKAAEELDIQRSTLIRTIRVLELYLGTTLLKGAAKVRLETIKLTPDGQSFYGQLPRPEGRSL